MPGLNAPPQAGERWDPNISSDHAHHVPLPHFLGGQGVGPGASLAPRRSSTSHTPFIYRPESSPVPSTSNGSPAPPFGLMSLSETPSTASESPSTERRTFSSFSYSLPTLAWPDPSPSPSRDQLPASFKNNFVIAEARAALERKAWGDVSRLLCPDGEPPTNPDSITANLLGQASRGRDTQRRWQAASNALDAGHYPQAIERLDDMLQKPFFPPELQFEVLARLSEAHLLNNDPGACLDTLELLDKLSPGREDVPHRRLLARSISMERQLSADLRMLKSTSGTSGRGTARDPYQTTTQDQGQFQSINAHPAYAHSSFEELRFEDYMDGRSPRHLAQPVNTVFGWPASKRPSSIARSPDVAALEASLERAREYIADSLLADAEDILMSRNYNRALVRLRSILELPWLARQRSTTARFLLASVLLVRGDFKESIEVCSTVLSTDHDHVGARTLRAEGYVAANDYEAAAKDLRAAIARSDPNARSSKSQGLLLMVNAEIQRQVLHAAGDMLLRGRSLVSTDREGALVQYNQARKKLDGAPSSNAQTAELAREIGVAKASVLIDLGYYSEAVKCINELPASAHRSNPQYFELYKLKATAKWRLGRHQEALDHLAECEAHNRADIVELRATVRRSAEQGAIEELDRLEDQANLKADVGHFDDAVRIYRKCLSDLDAPFGRAAATRRGRIHHALASALLKAKRPGEAILECKVVLADDPRSVKALRIKGLAEIAMSEFRHGLSTLQKALRLCDDPALREALQGDLSGLEKRAEDAELRKVENLMKTADSTFKKGKTSQKAIMEYTFALGQLSPGSGTKAAAFESLRRKLQIRLAHAHLQSAQYSQARRYAEAVLKTGSSFNATVCQARALIGLGLLSEALDMLRLANCAVSASKAGPTSSILTREIARLAAAVKPDYCR